MRETNIEKLVRELMIYGIKKNLFDERDVYYTFNRVLEALKLDAAPAAEDILVKDAHDSARNILPEPRFSSRVPVIAWSAMKSAELLITPPSGVRTRIGVPVSTVAVVCKMAPFSMMNFWFDAFMAPRLP